MNKENSSNMIRLLAGGYLLYLSYQMITDGVGNEWWMIAATVLFVASGASFLFLGIKGMIKQSQLSEEEIADENSNEDLEEQEELYGEFVEPGLTDGKMKGIEQELEKLKNKDAKDIIEEQE